MLTVQEMLEIALRHTTAMADAMVAACVAWSVETGVKLRGLTRIDTRGSIAAPVEAGAVDVDWERMMRSNSDTRWMHV